MALTQHVDIAQVVLYAFWAFFFGLIYYLRREDRREGFPAEDDMSGRLEPTGATSFPAPKTFLLPHGGTYSAPNDLRDTREIKTRRTANFPGAPYEPTGDPMVDGVGAAAWADRKDEPELTREGHHAVVPLRVAHEYSVDTGDTDPRGLPVVAADGKVAGTVTDVWLDRADVIVRYLEVELPSSGRRLVPINMLRIQDEQVEVVSIKSSHFDNVPGLKNPDQITMLEEERIGAYYAGGRLYADPKRLGPLV